VRWERPLIDKSTRVYARIMLPTHCACTKLRRSARAVTAFYDAALDDSGLSTPQFSLLRLLDRSGPCSLTAFAEHTGHDRTTISRTVGALRDHGLVRFAEGGDQRARIVELAPAGKAAIARCLPAWEAAERHVDDLLGQDRVALFALLDRIEDIRP
jgi:DNA-binding MarR family transcriptional regulator